jgi:hypothetical protein
MPTDILEALKRKRDTRRQRKAAYAVLGGCLIICLLNIMLLFIDRSLAQALELLGNPSSEQLLCGTQIPAC